jgi:fructoselysine-6-P-deglycase FrlB-like protein
MITRDEGVDAFRKVLMLAEQQKDWTLVERAIGFIQTAGAKVTTTGPGEWFIQVYTEGSPDGS